MKFIPMTILEYRFDEKTNEVKSVIVQLNTYSTNDSFNGRIELTKEYIHTITPGLDMDRINKAQCDIYARRLLRDWINVRPEESEEGPAE